MATSSRHKPLTICTPCNGVDKKMPFLFVVFYSKEEKLHHKKGEKRDLRSSLGLLFELLRRPLRSDKGLSEGGFFSFLMVFPIRPKTPGKERKVHTTQKSSRIKSNKKGLGKQLSYAQKPCTYVNF